MGKKIEKGHIGKLKSLLENMGLKLNEEKTKVVKATEESFDFLGFSFKYDNDLYGNPWKYWNVCPSKKSENKAREKLKKYFKESRHLNKYELVEGLNSQIRGFINYFEIAGESYLYKYRSNLRHYLRLKIYKLYKKKSQRSCKLYNKGVYEILKKRYGLIEITDYRRLVKAREES